MHRGVYRLTRGKVGGRVRNAPILLLTTKGRKSGTMRTVPLIYVEDDGRFVVIGSNAGQDHHPSWLLNLQANPEVRVEVGARQMFARARIVAGEERDRLWPAAVATWRGFEAYAKRTERHINLVVLEPK